MGTHLNLGERIGLLRLPASDMRKVHANFGAKTSYLVHLRWGNTRTTKTGHKAPTGIARGKWRKSRGDDGERASGNGGRAGNGGGAWRRWRRWCRLGGDREVFARSDAM